MHAARPLVPNTLPQTYMSQSHVCLGDDPFCVQALPNLCCACCLIAVGPSWIGFEHSVDPAGHKETVIQIKNQDKLLSACNWTFTSAAFACTFVVEKVRAVHTGPGTARLPGIPLAGAHATSPALPDRHGHAQCT